MKSASGYQNAELEKLVFLRPYLKDAKISNARSASLVRDTTPASLLQNEGLMKSASFKCRQANVINSNATVSYTHLTLPTKRIV